MTDEEFYRSIYPNGIPVSLLESFGIWVHDAPMEKCSKCGKVDVSPGKLCGSCSHRDKLKARRGH